MRKNGLILGEMVYETGYVPVYFAEEKKYDLMLIDGKTIILDESLLHNRSNGRLRFTCAHEIAHWILHKGLFLGTGQAAAFVNSKFSSQELPAIERQANILATFLLMPTVQVKKAFYAVQGTLDPVTPLSKLFEVSKQAMNIFLQEHNLT